MARFEVYVVPGSSRPGPHGRYDGTPRLRVNAPPADHRANKEAERLLTRLLGSKVRLVGGDRSRRKLFEADLQASVIASRLRAAFGG